MTLLKKGATLRLIDVSGEVRDAFTYPRQRKDASANNRGVIRDGNGRVLDYVELRNIASEPISSGLRPQRVRLWPA